MALQKTSTLNAQAAGVLSHYDYRTGYTITSSGATEWQRNGAVISGATGESYTLTSADEFCRISNNGAAGAVLALPAFAAPSISADVAGTFKVGDTAYATIAALGGWPLPKVTFSRALDGVSVGKTNGWDYKLPSTGSLVTTITATNAEGTATTSSTDTVTAAGASVQNFGVADPSLATNTTDITPWMSVAMMLDWMKISLPFSSPSQTFDQLQANGHLDANGWPTGTFPAGDSHVSCAWDRQVRYDAGTEGYRGVSFRVRWTGAANCVTPVVFGGSGAPLNLNRVSNNELTFDFDGGAIYLDVTGAASDITMVLTHYADRFDAGEVFDPDYLRPHKDCSVIRHMDYFVTNGSNFENFSDFAPLSRATYNTKDETATGIGRASPIELAVRMANECRADPWFCIPHKATDAAVTAMAEYVRDNLDSDLTARWEYSNEPWNTATPFTQYIYFRDTSAAEWPSSTAPEHTRVINWYAKRATECFQLIDAAYSGSGKLHKKVLGSQTAGIGNSTMMCDADEWQAQEPGSYVQPSTVADELAVNSYYSHSLASPSRDAEILAAYPNGNYKEIIFNYMMADDGGIGICGLIPLYLEQKAAANARGLDLVLYEGGCHAWGPNRDANPDTQAPIFDFMDSEFGREVTAVNFEVWKRIGQGPYMNFSAVTGSATEWAYGTADGTPWTYMVGPDEDEKKEFAHSLEVLNRLHQNWWGGATDGRYQHVAG